MSTDKGGTLNPSNYNYTEELAIDTDALDVEWLMQPQLYMKWAELYVDAEMLYDKAKEKLEYVRAVLDNRVRSNPVIFTKSDKKPTEAQISGIVITDDEYIEASASYITAKRAFKNLGMALKAFEQRKNALENLVRLHGQSYFASPNCSTDRTLSESVSASAKRRSEVEAKVKRRLELNKAKQEKQVEEV